MPENPSSSFELLSVEVQRWVWRAEWPHLRDVQERAIPAILGADRDVVIAAATAAGKTEAAFLPICSSLTADGTGGVRALYVGPLKALINDQFRRLDELCEHLQIPVHRWHGDVDSKRKKRLLDSPSGVLLITPESLEAIAVIHGHRLGGLFARLDHVVVDELHAFIGSARGRQLQSLLHRIELAIRRRVPRIGLSATLGDMQLAARFLRPRGDFPVEIIASEAEGQDLQLQLRGYRQSPPRRRLDGGTGGDDLDDLQGHVLAIGSHLHRTLRGASNLVFANSRKDVELYADLLRRLSERRREPNEFFPHHGSLSRELRQDLEARLKRGGMPVTAVCTSTLEMGIDIGAVKSIAQVGPPHSVSTLRQRLGRSGRRGDPAILRLYIAARELDERSGPVEPLHQPLVQAVAVVRLLLARWCEPPELGALQLSTLVHQILSLIAQCGGVRATEAWRALCRSGPFEHIDQSMFADLLRDMGEEELITQTAEQDLVLDLKGEAIVGHYSFFATFESGDEYRVLADGRLLGTMAVPVGLAIGIHIIFTGRRWKVLAVDDQERVVIVAPSGGGRLPDFDFQQGGSVHDRVRLEMKAVYEDGELPAYLDATAAEVLLEARAHHARLGFSADPIRQVGTDCLVFLCRGDRIANTVVALLAGIGLQVDAQQAVLIVRKVAPSDLRRRLAAVLEQPPPDPIAVATGFEAKRSAKYDWVLSDELLTADFASRALDIPGAWEALADLLSSR